MQLSTSLLNGNGCNGHHHHRHEEDDELGDQHLPTALETPMRADAFALGDDEKIEAIAQHFEQIMHLLGLDLRDDSLRGTPRRVAKMYVKEVFSGLNPANRPQPTLFENRYRYRQMLVERNIPMRSTCEHHFQPILGVAHIAYFSKGKVIGLSKLNRVVEYYSRRPQVQERLTVQIAQELRRVLQSDDVAVYLDAAHLCVSQRGIQHQGCSTVTSEYSGKFLNEQVRNEFLAAIK
jgi:GTP cyclohydrolase I